MLCLIIVLFCLSLFKLEASDVNDKSTMLEIFEGHTKTQLEEVYKAAPASLTIFLKKKDIVRPIAFRSTFEAQGVGMGTDKKTVIFSFNKYLRESIENKFEKEKITEIRPEDLSVDITQNYEGQLFHRPDPGQKHAIVIRFEKKYKGKEGGPFMTLVYAYVYMEITEVCENNWIMQNQRRFDYFLNIEISGLSVNRDEVNKLREVIDNEGVPKAIGFIKSKAALSFKDL